MRERERERVKERERKSEREKERKRVRERERVGVNMYQLLLHYKFLFRSSLAGPRDLVQHPVQTKKSFPRIRMLFGRK